jgi:hypothetical protein
MTYYDLGLGTTVFSLKLEESVCVSHPTEALDFVLSQFTMTAQFTMTPKMVIGHKKAGGVVKQPSLHSIESSYHS